MTELFDALLIWNASTAPDFDRFNIYRYNEGTEEWDLVGTPKAPAFTDKNLPAGSYYYIVTAVDKKGNESGPSDILEKTLPELDAPSTPTWLAAERNGDRTAIVLTWNPNVPSERVKGYIIYRSLNSGSTWTAIDITSSNKYTDSNFPQPADPKLGQKARYCIQAYNADMSASAVTTGTTALEIALIPGFRTILDYLSLNVYWDPPVPERCYVNYVGIFYKKLGAASWTEAGYVYYPGSMLRIEGPLEEGATYLIGHVINYPSATYIRDYQLAVKIPTYEHDATLPTAPGQVQCSYDPDTDIGYINWQRDAVDDDLLYYEVRILSATSMQFELHGTSKDSNYVLRNASKYLIPDHYGIVVLILGVDRSGNVSLATAFGTIYIRPEFEEFNATYDNELNTEINPLIMTDYSSKYTAVIDFQWADMGRKSREFRRYIVFETRVFQPPDDIPIFSFTNEEIKIITTTNSARICLYDAYQLAGMWYAWTVAVEDGQGNVVYGNYVLIQKFPDPWP